MEDSKAIVMLDAGPERVGARELPLVGRQPAARSLEVVELRFVGDNKLAQRRKRDHLHVELPDVGVVDPELLEVVEVLDRRAEPFDFGLVQQQLLQVLAARLVPLYLTSAL